MSTEQPVFENILYSSAEGICRITMNRPEVRNALTFPMIRELNEAVKHADADPDIRVIIIAGAGPTFCSGHDLSESGLREYARRSPNLESLWAAEEKSYVQEHGLDIWDVDTVTIAQVQGVAVLGGFVVANVCDLVMASDDAVFWMPALRMHMPGAEVFLEPWVMGHRRAKEFLFTGEQLGAEEAYRIGMVNHVVPRDELESATTALAERIALQPATALKLAKRSVNKTLDAQGFRQAIEQAFLLHIIGHGTEAYQREVWRPMLEKVGQDGFSSYLSERDKSFGQAH